MTTCEWKEVKSSRAITLLFYWWWICWQFSIPRILWNSWLDSVICIRRSFGLEKSYLVLKSTTRTIHPSMNPSFDGNNQWIAFVRFCKTGVWREHSFPSFLCNIVSMVSTAAPCFLHFCVSIRQEVSPNHYFQGLKFLSLSLFLLHSQHLDS